MIDIQAFFNNNKNYVEFILLLCWYMFLIIATFILKLKFIKLKSNTTFVKILQVVVKSIYSPIIFFCLIHIVSNENNFFLQYIDEYFIIIIRKLKATGAVILIWFCFANLTANIESIIFKKGNDALEKKLLNLVIKFIKFFSYITIIFMILRLLGFNIVKVIENAGGSTAIITSALLLIYKSQVSNVFSGLLILLNKTFKIGNRISLPEKKISGKILDIGLSKIKILTDEQKVITFPNQYLSNTPYYNLSECNNSFIKKTFYLECEDYKKIDTVVKIIYDMVNQIHEINRDFPINIYLDEISEKSALLLNVEFFINTTESARIRDTKQFIILKSLEILMSNGCHIFKESK